MQHPTANKQFFLMERWDRCIPRPFSSDPYAF